MLIKITVEIPDEPFQGLLAAVWSLIGGAPRPANAPESPTSAPVVEVPVSEGPPPSKRTRKPKEEPAAAEAPETPADEFAASEATEKPTEASPTVEDVLKRAADFMKDTKDGAAIVSGILKDMGFKKVREIPVEALPTFLAKLAAA